MDGLENAIVVVVRICLCNGVDAKYKPLLGCHAEKYRVCHELDQLLRREMILITYVIHQGEVHQFVSPPV